MAMRKRTVTVLFSCDLCEIKQKTLKYCIRHGHEPRKVDVEEDDDQNLGNETMNHTDFEIMYPGRKVSHGRHAPLFETDADAGTSNEGANNHSEDTVATFMLQAPTYHDPDEEEETEVDTFDVSGEVAQLQLAPPPLKAPPSKEPVLWL
eukprot:CAMPEP_0179435546 /NCGR_PEP_ID=MMETSP0799-20121207/19633_1 /TAXON_ID=46947 /ORGANISM="Geminigera cryophila, Strain CCMP2564" /LENGTH=148 /DNA_ID=CAMNT_0021214979 /DNA_START=242 /DNA_END=688 /DNA_ORIENTATION=-